MCILCVIQKWSRRIATMLPWLIIPLIGLWALSQLLPPAFRFEITSSKLACLFVLLVTLFWYEVLVPQLSAWRVRRNARLRERKRFEAIELQKLRKTATRRCRNCLTAYRDQNPGGGKFMCSYCGHISKRPVLDLPVPPRMGNSEILKDLVGKGGKILKVKGWSDNGWMCGQDWLENGNWAGRPLAGKSSYWNKDGRGLFGGDDDHCLAKKSYSRVFIFACKALKATLYSVVWPWRKIFRGTSSRGDVSADAERRGILDNQGENGGNGQESRGDKARRKAEEKRQARLEKELLEEEERKQRQEVARLVEERRRLREEKMEAEKERGKGFPRAKEREIKKEYERKSREKKKEKDRGSSKSNSDAEELEKRADKESDRKKKSDSDRREEQRTTPESMKTHGTELGHGFNGSAAGNHNRGNAGTRYLDRMRGNCFPSSRAFTGSGFSVKSTNSSTVSREHKPSTLVENAQTSTRKEIVQPDQVSGKSTVNGDDKSTNRLVLTEPQPCAATKKSWQHLFTRSSVVPPSNSNVISRPSGKYSAEVRGLPSSSDPTSTQSFDNPIDFGLMSPFSLPSFPFGSSNSCTILPVSSEAMPPKLGDLPHQLLPDESEIFEDPCYVPDPISLLGPVSESLDSFHLDLGFVNDTVLEKSCAMEAKAASSEVTKPSPVESPLSRSRVSEDNYNSINDNGTWQMWNSSPLVQDDLGLVGGPVNWLLHPEMNMPNKEDNLCQVPHKTMASLFKKNEQTSVVSHPSHVLFGNSLNDGTLDAYVPPIVDGPCLPRTLFGPTSGPENQVLLKPKGEAVQNGLIYGNSSVSAASHQFELSAANSWAKKDWTAQSSRDSVGSLSISKPQIGGLYSPRDVQSLWSYE